MQSFFFLLLLMLIFSCNNSMIFRIIEYSINMFFVSGNFKTEREFLYGFVPACGEQKTVAQKLLRLLWSVCVRRQAFALSVVRQKARRLEEGDQIKWPQSERSL